MKIRTILVSVIVANVIAITAFAHNGATGIVKERMDSMSTMGKAIKAITPMMRKEINYDAALVRQNALNIKMHSGEVLTKLYPQGTGGMPSEAKDNIWQEWEEFTHLSKQLLTYSDALALAADNGLSEVKEKTPDVNSMMGGSSSVMMGASPLSETEASLEELSKMPAEKVFAKVIKTCSACHTKFRAEAKK